MTDADPQAVVAGLPDVLWPPLAQAVRTASDRLGRSQLPGILQPYAGFTPARLSQGRAKHAVATALAGDARLREAVGRALGDRAWERAESLSAGELVERLGAPRATAALVARGRWDDVRTLAERTPVAEQPVAQPPARRLEDERPDLASLRNERDTAQRRAAAAEKRAGDLQSEIASLRRQIEDLQTARAAVAKRLDEDRARARDRMARLQRRVSDAESRARREATRFVTVAAELERLAAALRGESQSPAANSVPAAVSKPPAIPRTVQAATPGRPSLLPAGLTDGHRDAVLSLLAIPGVEVVLDGYNVTKDLRGVPAATLPDQRAWLVRIAAAVAAGRDLRMWIVFDGAGDRTSAAAAARVVRCVFTSEGETADERIVAMVRGTGADQPVVVVTSDLQVRAACEELGANVVASGAFLAAVA